VRDFVVLEALVTLRRRRWRYAFHNLVGEVMTNIPGGWYPDESVTGGERYWDGRGWTDARRSPGNPVVKPRRQWVVPVCVVAALIVAGVVYELTNGFWGIYGR
jgi:hypothetical protein